MLYRKLVLGAAIPQRTVYPYYMLLGDGRYYHFLEPDLEIPLPKTFTFHRAEKVLALAFKIDVLPQASFYPAVLIGRAAPLHR